MSSGVAKLFMAILVVNLLTLFAIISTSGPATPKIIIQDAAGLANKAASKPLAGVPTSPKADDVPSEKTLFQEDEHWPVPTKPERPTANTESSGNNLFNNKNHEFRFDNPAVALKVLNEFDTYIPLPRSLQRKQKYFKKFHAIAKQDDYCDVSRQYFVYNPMEWFERQNVMIDHPYDSLIRNIVMMEIGGKDMHPEIMKYTASSYDDYDEIFHLKPAISSYFVGYSKGMHYRYMYLRNFGCNHQLYNHIYGGKDLITKGAFSENYRNYMDGYKSGASKCNIEEFVPESFIMRNKTQCLEFFQYINTTQYAKEKAELTYVFFKKLASGSHMGQGVFLFTQKSETNIRALYEEGAKCGKVNKNYQMQKYLPNPMLLYGFKFDFRVYMLIASTNPMIVYYHDGFLKLSLQKYVRTSKQRGKHLANTHVSARIFTKARHGGWNGMNESQTRAFQTWTYDRLQTYLIENNKTTDNNWIENSLRPQMKKAIAHIIRMTQQGFVRRSGVAGLFGVDFILDENLKLWFLEANPSPSLAAPTPEREKILLKMLIDYFEVTYSYLRSRLKRVINYVNRVANELPEENILHDSVIIKDFYKKKTEYNFVNRNQLEKPFSFPKTNGFQLVLDENLNGTARYSEFIPRECL
jgi:tubulin polyglutamylase TTLL1